MTLESDRLESEFDATAEHYDVMVGLNPGYHEHLRTAADALAERLTPGDGPLRLADLGCGSGASTVALVDALGPAASDAEILGVDASDGMLAVARRKAWPAGVRFQHGMAEDVAAGHWGLDRPLDGVLACYLFRNVQDRDGAVAAVYDVLAPDGWLVVQEYSVAGSRRSAALWTFICWAVVIPLSLVLTRRTTLYRYLWRSVLRFDSVTRFEARLRAAGFTDVSTRSVDGWQHGILHTVVGRRPAA
ncbi:class I SAM-dependent methyltransferase [uncultured Jatrophihabitans sp.]|uniref:class I SAM-dependent methyltransferase n=1 Tax=uncultured Jatrophihabitans sp. TaxID=1610747 RepID=UPI0035CC4E32